MATGSGSKCPRKPHYTLLMTTYGHVIKQSCDLVGGGSLS